MSRWAGAWGGSVLRLRARGDACAWTDESDSASQPTRPTHPQMLPPNLGGSSAPRPVDQAWGLLDAVRAAQQESQDRTAQDRPARQQPPAWTGPSSCGAEEEDEDEWEDALSDCSWEDERSRDPAAADPPRPELRSFAPDLGPSAAEDAVVEIKRRTGAGGKLGAKAEKPGRRRRFAGVVAVVTAVAQKCRP
jgi:hypothetical protein